MALSRKDSSRSGVDNSFRKSLYIFTHTKFLHTELNQTKRSQSALEYMMTYGWAILIIVIVAVILYSMGIFNPSSSITTTSSGFSPFAVSSVICDQANLAVAVTAGGLPNSATSAEITAVYFSSNTGTTASTGKLYNISPAVTLAPGSSAMIILPTIRCNSGGNAFSLSTRLQYSYSTPAGKVITNATGTISGTSSSSKTPVLVANFSQIPPGYINVSFASKNTPSEITVSFWVYPINHGYWGAGNNPWEPVVTLTGLLNPAGSGCASADSYIFILEAGANPPVESWSTDNCSTREFPGLSVTPNTWQQFTGVYNGSYLIVYHNGNNIGSKKNILSLETFDRIFISGTVSPTTGGGSPVSGYLSNVQIYNTALSAQQVSQLYSEGIEGAPLNNINLIGWWPLDGNANDYSGNNNNGVPTNVQWVSP